MDVLRNALAELPAGSVPEERRSEVEEALAAVWTSLDFPHGDGGMTPYKIHRRTEGLEWDPPELTFEIERHGAMKFGSVYADVQPWTVNVEEGTARVGNERKRLVGERQPAWDEQPVADELAEAMRERRDDERLRWAKTTGRVQVRSSKVLPFAAKQTTQSRRKRLNDALMERLGPRGWSRTGSWWTPPEVDDG